jgi:hypothetical protein
MAVTYNRYDITRYVVQPENSNDIKDVLAELHVNDANESSTSLMYTSMGSWNTKMFQMFKGSTPDQVSMQFAENNGSRGIYVGNSDNINNLGLPTGFKDACEKVDNSSYAAAQTGPNPIVTCPQGYYWNGTNCVRNVTEFYFKIDKLTGVYKIEQEGNNFALVIGAPNAIIVIRFTQQ